MMTRFPTPHPVIFTAHENNIVRLISEGKSSKEIGVELSIAESTVKNLLHRIFVKTGTANRAELVASYTRNGMLICERTKRLVDEDVRYLGVSATKTVENVVPKLKTARNRWKTG